MSHQDVEIVRRSYEVFMRGDAKAALSAYSPDIEWDDTRFRPEGKVHRGRDEVAELVRTWVGTWTDYSIELERVLDAVVTVDGGQITRTVVYSDPAEALEAAGLSE